MNVTRANFGIRLWCRIGSLRHQTSRLHCLCSWSVGPVPGTQPHKKSMTSRRAVLKDSRKTAPWLSPMFPNQQTLAGIPAKALPCQRTLAGLLDRSSLSARLCTRPIDQQLGCTFKGIKLLVNVTDVFGCEGLFRKA
jgi:hypothetical protein